MSRPLIVLCVEWTIRKRGMKRWRQRRWRVDEESGPVCDGDKRTDTHLQNFPPLLWCWIKSEQTEKQRVLMCVRVITETGEVLFIFFLCSGMPTSEETPPPPASHASTYTVETSVWTNTHKQTHTQRHAHHSCPGEGFRWCNTPLAAILGVRCLTATTFSLH